ncbi:hypothetical protein RMSM_06359 [Rhodopirellula maiorica SM1]|uniref:Uncharacterized protein n=1 Tax=Rhodopirellula maiorica SM1 TaxID=1265738 RepID=M5RB46_9BACT|nr:hypothetical protein RMSM_06359 [Rhodopirellula maiorica SM1]
MLVYTPDVWFDNSGLDDVREKRPLRGTKAIAARTSMAAGEKAIHERL